jgi:hypothetical protein
VPWLELPCPNVLWPEVLALPLSEPEALPLVLLLEGEVELVLP